MELLVFELAGRRYGLPLAVVREVVRAVAVSPLPRAPSVVEGVVDVRGTLVPVLDVRGRFGHAAQPLDPADHFIVAVAGARRVVLRVDRAEWIVSVAAEDVEAADRIGLGAGYVAGVARLRDGLVLIHDLETFLSQAEVEALQAALAGAAAGTGEA